MHRLQTQAEEFSAFVVGALQKIGINAGMSAADIGCGTGDVSFALSSLIGPNGSVVGLDANPKAIEFCRNMALKKDIKNIEFEIGDVRKMDLASNHFDVVFSRFLLQHVKDPSGSLKEMIRITKPSGVIMVEDCDLQSWIVEPKDKYIEQLWKWYESIIEEKGSDPMIGRKLYKMFMENGLEPQVEVYSLPIIWDNRRIWDSITNVLKRINNPSSIALIDGIENFKQKRESMFIFPLVFRVWARK